MLRWLPLRRAASLLCRGAGDIEIQRGSVRYVCPQEFNEDEGSKISTTPSQASASKNNGEEEDEQEEIQDEDKYSINIDMSVLNTRKQHGSECQYFTNIQDLAYSLVDDVIDEARDILSTRYNCDVEIKRQRSTAANIIWPTISEFTRELGKKKLREYIDLTADVTENWEYSLNLIAGMSNSVSDFLMYEAVFSIPTKCYPVPQATATVLFTYEISRVKPKSCVVDVSYQVESFRTVLYPEKNLITEDLLFRVLHSKLRFFKTVAY
ncbi:unnamed protein product [Acanthoscelides obtectus]|uniref:Uncharacterized protein n=1 Tax=Acanthoscelides obtectus TaxID=200917 RepID=A0A9P0JMB8_ACAOB|nr:unnamed protein product [Acanthoscelides obtectus]CAK1634858.1 A-kinase anchor protein 14 [Acanthoscelides obtectus]